MVIHFVPRIIKWFFGRFTWNKDRKERKLYLTFDDGPVPGVTDFVLNELHKRGMKATFFVVGDNLEKYPDLAAKIVLEGHQLGNHTYNHLRGTSAEDKEYFANIEKCSRAIAAVSGFRPRLFRPPYGRIKKRQVDQLIKDYEIVLWDVLSGDYHPGQSAETCLSKTMQYTRSGSIVLFHDQEKTERVVKAVLPRYLDYIQSEGYETALL
ncbi:polysaccharide deacetylase family protein [Echinicola sediminis]